MRRLLAAFGALIVAGFCGGLAFVLLAAPAHADADTYGGGYPDDQDAYAYNRLELRLGAHSTPASAERFARDICWKMRAGRPEWSIIASAPRGWTAGEATLAVHGAEFHFCPDEY